MLRFVENNKYRSSCPDVLCNKGALKNFAKLTVNQLRQSLFFNKAAVLAGLKTEPAFANIITFITHVKKITCL